MHLNTLYSTRNETKQYSLYKLRTKHIFHNNLRDTMCSPYTKSEQQNLQVSLKKIYKRTRNI